jgi:hypothetical protein
LWKLEVEHPQLFEALQDPFSRFVMLTVHRAMKFIRIITSGKCCRI